MTHRTSPSHAKGTLDETITAIDWNTIPDETDLEIWDRLTANFWLPEKVPLSNDIVSWNGLSEDEQGATMKVFSGLTALDTIQGTVGAVTLIPHAETMHEEAVYTNIAFMESVHAKSYSSIFQTLATTPQIREAFDWINDNEQLQFKAKTILEMYRSPIIPIRFAASTLLESFLFYSGFFLPLKFAAHAKLTNTADIIRLIIRDEAVHGFYIGYKFRTMLANYPIEEQRTIKQLVVDKMLALYENELEFTKDIYDPIGWTAEVNQFLRYNANKALQNLGIPEHFSPEESQPPAYILAAMSPDTGEAHDFFSGSGASYVMGTAEDTEDEDWEF